MSNSFWFIDNNGNASELDTRAAVKLGFALGYHLRVLQLLSPDQIHGLTFYLCVHPPAALPSCGSSVVLLILSDEYHTSYSYFSEILAVMRCYGNRPCYLEGFPTTLLQLSAAFQFVYKTARFWSAQAHLLPARSKTTTRGVSLSPLHLPLGCFQESSCQPMEFDVRPIDFAFLGSIGTSGDKFPKFSPRALMLPPKVRARKEMAAGLQVALRNAKWRGVFETTATFADSTEKQHSYDATISQTKISICPRGSNCETYRFFESCRAGCVVIGDPLPNTWFYRGHPGIVIRNWAELPELLDRLLGDPEGLRERAAATRAFWKDRLAEQAIVAPIQAFLTRAMQKRDELSAGKSTAHTLLSQA